MSAASTTSAPAKISTKSTSAPKMTRKERRFQREVTQLQEQQSHLLPQTTFKRCVQQFAMDLSTERLRFNADAIDALQEAAEDEITRVFKGANMVAAVAKRDTVTVEDMKNYLAIREI